MANELMLIQQELINNLKNILPPYKGGKSKAATGLINAWTESIYLDSVSGGLYVKTDRLHTILRFQRKSDAQHFIDGLSKERKIEIGNAVYVATDEVIAHLNRRMVGADLKKRNYLTYSEEILINIRDSAAVTLKQEEIRQLEEATIKQLKEKRIRHFNIKKDELTNLPLKKRSAEFSHIRKKSNYRIYACNIHNGLIVNKETHQFITEQNIHNEEQLLALCKMQKWNTNWYDSYKSIFQS